MKLSRKWQQRIQQSLFYLLLAVVVFAVAKLSLTTNTAFDWTQNQRHSLSDTTITLLQNLDETVAVNIFVSPDNDYAKPLRQLTSRYQRYTEKLQVTFIDPAKSPKQVRDFNIQQQGEIRLIRNQQIEKVQDLSEQSLTNALLRITRQQKPTVVFIDGHGERIPDSQTNFDLGLLAQALKNQGLTIAPVNIAQQGSIPAETDLLVLASPERDWLAAELKQLLTYIDNGGNLLWLSEPDRHQSLNQLADRLGLQWLPGTIIDPNASLLGINEPGFTLISNFADHAITQELDSVVLLPAVAALTVTENSRWQTTNLLQTAADSWAELSTLNEAEFNQQTDIAGPLTSGLLLERKLEDSEQSQRIITIGDGDFLSNQYIGNAANQSFAMAMFNWLTGAEESVSIDIKNTPDQQLLLTQTQTLVIAIGFLFVLPLVLFISGMIIWWRRRRR